MPEFRFDAFVSYRRSDGSAAAHWLRRQLEGFQVPKSLRPLYGRPLKIYLDTAYERATADFYENSIKPALLSSHYLFVLATPDAVRRRTSGEDWIEREISDFANGPNGTNVIAVRGGGEFNDPLPGGLLERFPRIEIVDLRGASRFWFLNPARAARLSSEKLKLVAPLLALPDETMPQLRQEEEKRQQTQLGLATGTVLGVLTAVGGLSVMALHSQNQAARALDDGMFAVSGMALQASSLDNAGGKGGRVRALLLNQGCDLIDKFHQSAASDPPIGGLVMCRLERALEREKIGEHELAQINYQQAIDLSTARYAKLPRVDPALRLLDARQARAEYLTRQKDAAGAEDELRKMLAAAVQFAKAHEGRSEFAKAEGEALGLIGDIRASENDHKAASESYAKAANAVARHIEIKLVPPETTPDALTAAWLARLHRLAGEQSIALRDAGQAVVHFTTGLEVRSRFGSDGVPIAVEIELATISALLSLAERERGNAAAAETARKAALDGALRVESAKNVNSEDKERALNIKKWAENQTASN